MSNDVIENEVVEQTLVNPEELKEETSVEDVMYDNSQDEKVEAESKEAESSEEKVASDEDANLDENKPEDSEAVEYKLKLEENSLLDNSHVEQVTDWAKEHNLSNEQAQELLSWQEKSLSNWIEANQKLHEEEVKSWRDQVINDETMGRQHLKQTVADARGFVKKFGSPEFIKMLDDTGYGDHPEVVRMFAMAGAAMNDDSLVMPKAHVTTKPIEEVFYGNN